MMMRPICFPLPAAIDCLGLAVLIGFLLARLLLFSSPPSPLAPLPATLSDTSVCRAHPSPVTCDGRLPIATWDSGIAAGAQGEGACLSALREEAQDPLEDPATHQSIGSIHLLWSPSCHTHFAHLVVERTVASIGISLSQLDTPAPRTDGTVPDHRTVSSFVDFSGGLGEITHAYSPLLFQKANSTRIAITATITLASAQSIRASFLWSPNAPTAPQP